MLKKIRELWSRDLVTPIVHKTFTRIIMALTFSLLWNEFINKGMAPMRTFAFTFFGVLFAVAAWVSYLRLDDIKVPQFDKKLFDWKKTPKRSMGDMIDYVDERPAPYEELEPDEQTLCLLVANCVSCLFFVVLALV